MRWGIVRLIIVGTAFLVGMLVAGFTNSVVMAPAASTADLPSTMGTSLVVTCETGDPTVEHVAGSSTAVQVRCVKSQMRVTRFGPSVRRDAPALKMVPAVPIAALVPEIVDQPSNCLGICVPR